MRRKGKSTAGNPPLQRCVQRWPWSGWDGHAASCTRDCRAATDEAPVGESPRPLAHPLYLVSPPLLAGHPPLCCLAVAASCSRVWMRGEWDGKRRGGGVWSEAFVASGGSRATWCVAWETSCAHSVEAFGPGMDQSGKFGEVSATPKTRRQPKAASLRRGLGTRGRQLMWLRSVGTQWQAAPCPSTNSCQMFGMFGLS